MQEWCSLCHWYLKQKSTYRFTIFRHMAGDFWWNHYCYFCLTCRTSPRSEKSWSSMGGEWPVWRGERERKVKSNIVSLLGKQMLNPSGFTLISDLAAPLVLWQNFSKIDAKYQFDIITKQVLSQTLGDLAFFETTLMFYLKLIFWTLKESVLQLSRKLCCNAYRCHLWLFIEFHRI